MSARERNDSDETKTSTPTDALRTWCSSLDVPPKKVVAVTQMMVGSFCSKRLPGTSASEPVIARADGPETKRETSSQDPTSGGPAITSSGTRTTCGADTVTECLGTSSDATP
eukprot:2460679-Rhodomonas_salina.3